jgi:S-adenosylhomocysteine hydrolase
MPPLIPPIGPVRVAARTAVVAGTATAVGTGVAHHQREKYAQEDAAAAEHEAAVVDYPAERPPVESDYITELQKLAELRASGVITEDEFEAKKKQILRI